MKVSGGYVTMCCDSMHYAFNENLIRYGDISDEPIRNKRVNICQLKQNNNIFSNKKTYGLTPIRFCPFCGTEITIES